MKRNLLLVIMLLCTNLQSFGQMNGKIQDLIEIKNRPLLVVLPDSRDGKTATELDRVKTTIKAKVESLWTLNHDITYINASELDALKKKKKKDISTHAVLRFLTWEVTHIKETHNTTWISSTLNIGLLERAVGSNYTYIHNYDQTYPSDGEIVSSLLQVQNVINKSIRDKDEMSYPKESKANADKLKNVTLLIDNALMKNRISDEVIKEQYGLPFKVVDKQEIEDAIINQKPGYAYIYIFPASITKPELMIQAVLDTEKGEVLAHSFPPLLRVGFVYGRRIGAANLKDYSKYVQK
ncbi:hypothetical protein [Pontibacter liquoris]|uniref:hypothetical protein n=1 Tax=Pontibacter liquoris TaxID=2905677 RepID=UPI001FA8099D|nr:hypothetical protein [Pontibacter liquoris]